MRGQHTSVYWVARGVIQVIPEHTGEPLYPLGQRRITGTDEMPSYWECFGGSAKAEDGLTEVADADDEQAIPCLANTLKRELCEELRGITIISVGQVLYEYRRPYMQVPAEMRANLPPFDVYKSVHFLVDVQLPRVPVVDETKHCGFGFFRLKQVLILRPYVRSCSLEAIINADKLGLGLPIST